MVLRTLPRAVAASARCSRTMRFTSCARERGKNDARCAFSLCISNAPRSRKAATKDGATERQMGGRGR
eukprot:9104635-Pyramimonas_sp.AAC.1